MHYLRVKFNSSIQGAFAIPSVSLCQVWVRGSNSVKGEARLVLCSGVGLDASLQQMLYLCLLSGMGWLSIWLLCPCMFGTSRWRSERRACPSTTVEGPGLSPFASKHRPAEVSLSKAMSPAQLQGHSKVADGLKKRPFPVVINGFSSKTMIKDFTKQPIKQAEGFSFCSAG